MNIIVPKRQSNAQQFIAYPLRIAMNFDEVYGQSI
jgi:hypothetical protein